MTAPTAHRLAAAAALAIAAIVAAGCGAGSPAPVKTVTVTVAPSGPASTAPATPAPASPTPSPQPPAGPNPCPTRGLNVTLGPAQGAAGSIYLNVIFRNISGTTCTLYGYPGVSLAGGSPLSRIGLAAKEDPSIPRELVTLAPGTAANAQLRIVQAGNYPPARCHPVTASYVKIYPPNQTTPVYLAASYTGCKARIPLLTVGAVRPGTGGS